MTVPGTNDDPLPFTLDWLTEAGKRQEHLSVCPEGHLLVKGRSCWAPQRFSPDLRALYCAPVDHAPGTENP